MFARTAQGVKITTPWPYETLATREFIEGADSRWLQRNFRTLSFTLVNGSAVYRIVRKDWQTHAYVIERRD